MDKVSIIVPVYNLEDYIEKTVNSICSQSYRNIEIILVDDGSTDNSLQIIRELSAHDDRIIVLHQENAGVTSARLHGVQVATGDWIGFVDGDDLVEADMFEMLLENAHNYQADISHCGYQMVFPSRVDFYYNTGRIVEQDCAAGVKDLLAGQFIEPGLCNKLFRIELFTVLLSENLMDSTIKNMEDLLMNYYLFKQASKSVYQDVCPYHYILRKGSAATAQVNVKKLLDPLTVLHIIEADLVNADCKTIITARITAALIQNATIMVSGQGKALWQARRNSRIELREYNRLVQNGDYSRNLKIKAALAAYVPSFYGVVHTVYAKCTGSSSRYEVK